MPNINYFTLLRTDISVISVDRENRDLIVSGFCLLDFSCVRLFRCFGHCSYHTLDFTIEVVGPRCFAACQALSSIAFEPGSWLNRIDSMQFARCRSLQSICIPRSVEVLCESCFADCASLSLLTFESGSRVTRIERWAFLHCRLLQSICIPATVELIGGQCFLECRSISSDTPESSRDWLVRMHSLVVHRYGRFVFLRQLNFSHFFVSMELLCLRGRFSDWSWRIHFCGSVFLWW
jgi:hypothetical protein